MTWVQKSMQRGRGDSSNRQGLLHFSLLLGDHEHPRLLLTLVVRMTLAPAARIILMRSLVMSNSRSRIFSSSLGSVTRTCRTHKCGCQHHNGRWMTPHKALMRPGLLPSEMSACHLPRPVPCHRPLHALPFPPRWLALPDSPRAVCMPPHAPMPTHRRPDHTGSERKNDATATGPFLYGQAPRLSNSRSGTHKMSLLLLDWRGGAWGGTPCLNYLPPPTRPCPSPCMSPSPLPPPHPSLSPARPSSCAPSSGSCPGRRCARAAPSLIPPPRLSPARPSSCAPSSDSYPGKRCARAPRGAACPVPRAPG